MLESAVLSLTVKVMAFDGNGVLANSNVITAGPFLIDGAQDSRSQMPAPVAAPAAGSYQVGVSNRTVSFEFGAPIPGASFAFTTNGTTPVPNGNGVQILTQNCFRLALTLPSGVSSKTWTAQILTWDEGKSPSPIKTFTITLHL